MRDAVLGDSAASMLAQADDREQLIQACRDYFEISIGERRPTEQEKTEARRLTLSAAGFGDPTSDPIDKVNILKYPLATDQLELLLLFTRMEYAVYTILAKETSVVDGPYIPMLRYESRLQQALLDEDELELAILRQSALIETYLRMHTGVGQVKWEWTVKCAYHGEQLFGDATYADLEQVKEARNDYAHDWRIYIEAGTRPRLRAACRTGLKIIVDFLGTELTETFERYSNKHISKRLPVRWEDRDTSEIRPSSASVSVEIPCDHCGETFNPQNNWKRCPHCYSSHTYWEQ